VAKIYLMPIFIDQVGVSSFGRFHRRTPMDDKPEIAGSDGIRSCTTMFFWPFGFRGSHAKSNSLLPSWGMFLVPCEVSHEEWHESRDLMTSNGGSSPSGDEEFT
jgi:hypothetical protein